MRHGLIRREEHCPVWGKKAAFGPLFLFIYAAAAPRPHSLLAARARFALALDAPIDLLGLRPHNSGIAVADGCP